MHTLLQYTILTWCINSCCIAMPVVEWQCSVYDVGAFSITRNSIFELSGWSFFWLTKKNGFSGEPLQLFHSLYAVKGEEKVQILCPQDLAQLKIEVKTKEEALALVRLFTHKSSYVMFSFPTGVEVKPPDAFVEQTVDGFLIRRYLLLHPDAPYRFPPAPLIKITEEMKTNGEYHVLHSKIITYLPPELADHRLIRYIWE